MTIEQLSEERKELRQTLIKNRAMKGFKGLLTLLYSDKVHFIYELLQNAEDAKASEVKFFLNTDRLEFEHNGTCLFTIEDVDSITNIGSTTKADDATSIGKFGIGFKAVFAYTSTPEIESGPYHFRIHDMFVPETENLHPGALGERRTRFIFPFDNPDKPPKQAVTEIEDKLQKLNENTLMFLSNIRKIEYYLPDSTNGFLERIESVNDKNQIEISVMRPRNIVPDSTHFLRFEKDVSVKDEENDENKKCKIAVAFGMDKPKNQNRKIKPLKGQVNIYFPATKETSKLQFHMHAPFASTVARNSVRDCPANDELRDHLAVLVAESMHAIYDEKLLDVEFLATLPNNRDDLSPFYLPIQEKLIKEFNRAKLVPMKQGGHAPASGAFRTVRGERGLSDLIEDKDLGTLLGKDSSLPLWIANPPRLDSSREDNFLTMLKISEWTIENLIEILETESDQVMEWLKQKDFEQKDFEWHQDLYVLLDDFLQRAPSYPYDAARERKNKLSNLRIVRCIDDEYRIGSECHFSEDNEMSEEGFNYVAKCVYAIGQNKNQQKKARTLLEEIGVCEVDDAERVRMILKHRYKEDHLSHEDKKQHIKDMKRFIALVDDEPENAKLFKDYNIFETTGGTVSANCVFLDLPYLETGLSVCYEDDKYQKLLKDCNHRDIGDYPYFSLLYEESDIDLKKLGEFATKLGTRIKLEAKQDKIPPDHPEIKTERGWENFKTAINLDYDIPEFKILLSTPTIDKSKLIWQTMYSLSNDHLGARYQYNRTHPLKLGFSTLVWTLKQAEWVPQRNDGTFTFVCPCDALIERLPEGFPYEAEKKWFEAIEFGKKTREQKAEYNQRNQQAKDWNFDSIEELEKYAELRQLLSDGEITVDDLISQYRPQNREYSPDFPTTPVRDPKRRGKGILEQIRNAPKKEHVEKIRNVRETKEDINLKTTLEKWYTNKDSDAKEMVCQICKKEMPFKKNDGKYYFVAMEALTIKFKSDELPEYHFPKEFVAQYLALCPECAARYDYFVRSVEEGKNVMEELRNHIMNSEEMEFPLELGELETSIRFVEVHLHDLKEVLHYYENEYDPEDSTD